MDPRTTWQGFLASVGFQERKPQQALVAEIISTLSEDEQSFLVAAAGTGTGKSAAATVPAIAIARAQATGRPVIVSTATKNLQGQYYNKDLPVISEHFPLDGSAKPPTYAVLKGKGNYVCAEKTKEQGEGFARQYQLPSSPIEHSGDVSELRVPPKLRSLITISSNDCPGARVCPSAEKGLCFFEAAKFKAFNSDVVVVNHALLAIDAKLRMMTDGAVAILPAPSAVIIDEAHKFEDYVRNALGWMLSINQLYKWANDCLDDDDEAQDFKTMVEGLFKVALAHDPKRRQQLVSFKALRSTSSEINDMIRVVKNAANEWDREDQHSHESSDYRKAARCHNLVDQLSRLQSPEDDDNFWTEKDEAGSTLLYYKPRSVANFLREQLWGYTGTGAILMSATPPHRPTVRLGLDDDNTTSFRTPSPFDYQQQSLLYIDPRNAPPYNAPIEDQAAYVRARNNDMLNLIAASDGRALLLFTSWRDLRDTHDALASKLQQAGVTVLRQDRDSPTERDRLASTFVEDEHSVLFGTESFFEGIDVPGRALQLVVIAKLPFPAMEDPTRGGKLDFGEDMLPEMKMKVTQAAGRLIRSHTDRGAIAIFDNRLLTKGYGKQLLRQLPFSQMPRTTSVREAMDYLESLEDD